MSHSFYDKVKKYKASVSCSDIDFERIVKTPFFQDYLRNLLTSLRGDSMEKLQPVLLYGENEYGIAASRLEGHFLYLNAGSDLIRGFSTDVNKMYALLGYMFHEMGHVLFFQMREENLALARLKKGVLPSGADFQPKASEEEAYKELCRIAEKREREEVLYTLYRHLSDVISDYHDEECICGMGGALIRQGIQTVREGIFSTALSLEDMLKDESFSAFAVMLSLILQYARFGKAFVLDEKTRENTFYLDALDQAAVYIDAARNTDDVAEKYSALTGILVTLWPYIHIVTVTEAEADGTEPEDGDTEKKDSLLAQILAEENCDEEDCENCKPKKQEEEEDGQGGSECGEDGTPQEGDELQKQIQRAVGSCGGDSFSDPPANIMRSGAPHQAVEGSQEKEEFLNLQTEPPGKIIEHLLQRVTEDILQEEAEGMASEEQHSEALAKIHTGNAYSAHFGVQTNLTRAKAISGDREKYEEIIHVHSSYIRKIQKEIERILQEEECAVQKRRYMGRRIDAKNSYRVDQRFFSRKRNPDKVIDMAISILVDNSGSMEGERIEAAKSASILLTEVLERLEIPFSVASHCCENAMNYCIYRDFEDNRKAKYSINRMWPGGDNRDGMALEICGKFLTQRPEQDRLLIIISDGQPNSHGYTGSLAKKDIKSIVRSLRRQNVTTLAFAIGDDKKQVKDIYGEAYIDISDYEKFPRTLSRMIEREIITHIR